jgi:hypothetical protein
LASRAASRATTSCSSSFRGPWASSSWRCSYSSCTRTTPAAWCSPRS